MNDFNWFIAKEQTNPYHRPRIDWVRTFIQFIPFWFATGLLAGVVYFTYWLMS